MPRTTVSSKSTRRSRAETEARICEAASTLILNTQTGTVSVREIAEAAGVSHPLVIRYFGSKRGLMEACMERLASSIPQEPMSLSPYETLVPAVRAAFRERTQTRPFLQLALQAAPDTNPQLDQERGRHMLERVRTVRQRTMSLDAMEPLDPRLVTAAITALTIGWFVAEKWLERTFELEDIEEAELVEQVARLCACMGQLGQPSLTSAPMKAAEAGGATDATGASDPAETR